MQFKKVVQTLFLTMLGILISSNVCAEKLTEVYVNSDTSLADFSNVILRDLDVRGAQIIPPVWVQGEERNPRRWKLNNKNVRLMQEGFQAAIKEAVEKDNGYPIVTDEADGVLEIKISIISLTPYAQRGEKVITRGSGEIKIQLTLRDAMSGELLAIYEGDQQVGDEYQENTSRASRENAQALFVIWGQKIRRALDNAHRKT
jgi:hypothetical protein